MTVNKLTCPSCHATLRLAKPVAPGKLVRCPKCTKPVRVPEETAPTDPPEERVAPSRPAVARTPPARTRPEPDEDQEAEETPAPPKQGKVKKGGKATKVKSRSALALILVGGAAACLAVAGVVVFLFWNPFAASPSSQAATTKGTGNDGQPPITAVPTGVAKDAKTHADVYRQLIAVRKETLARLARINDVEAARTALPRLRELQQENAACFERFTQLGDIHVATFDQFEPELQKTNDATKVEKKRLAALPGVAALLNELEGTRTAGPVDPGPPMPPQPDAAEKARLEALKGRGATVEYNPGYRGTVLRFDGDAVTDDIFKDLKGLKSVTILSFSAATKVTDNGVRELEGLDNLNSLSLDGARVTGSAFAQLVRLKNIRSLWLEKTAVTDESLQALKDLPYLTLLSLRETGIGDAGLKHLQACKALKQLVIDDASKVTEKGAADFLAARPDVVLDDGFTRRAVRPTVVEALVGADNNPAFADVRPGQTVRIKGECVGVRDGGKMVTVQLGKRDTGTDPAVKVADLLRAYTDDRKTAEEKYSRKQLIVEGTVTAIESYRVILGGAK